MALQNHVENRKTCVLIGGGASAVLVALELLKIAPATLEFIIVEPSLALGRGLAYREAAEGDLLNVPAEKMCADLDDPLEFTEWLAAKFEQNEFGYWPFVPRTLFGQYLQEKLDPFLRAQKIQHLRAQVVSFCKIECGENFAYELTLDPAQKLNADFLIICTGYGVHAHEADSESKVIHDSNPELVTASAMTKGDSELFILGSGLSAIDIWRRNREKRVTLFSRHGFLPLPHLDSPRAVLVPLLSGKTPVELFRTLRNFKNQEIAHWQDIADAVRPQCGYLWSGWNQKEKNQFQRHLKRYWEVIRHRVPAKINY